MVRLFLSAPQMAGARFPSPHRGEDGGGALYGNPMTPNAPTPTLPLRGREYRASPREEK